MGKLMQKWSSKHFFDETLYYVLHGKLINFWETNFLVLCKASKIVLVLSLVELIHGPEASPKEEEVKLFHLFVASDERGTLKRVKRMLIGNLGMKTLLTDSLLGCWLKHHKGRARSLKFLLYHFFLLRGELKSLLF